PEDLTLFEFADDPDTAMLSLRNHLAADNADVEKEAPAISETAKP
ncbi:MAG: hypothetical protein JWO80_4679, partial [Bryobacterales bacterium]|nr:hypothetical protein [Bryobacterales bacterium]